MHRSFMILAAVVLSVGLAAAADGPGGTAGTTGSGTGQYHAGQNGMPSQSHDATTGKTTGNQNAATNQNPRVGYVEAAEAQGRLSKVDKQNGEVAVQMSDGGTLNLRLPTAAAQQLTKGDRVNVTSQVSLAELPGQQGQGTTSGNHMGSSSHGDTQGSGSSGSRSGASGTGSSGTRSSGTGSSR